MGVSCYLEVDVNGEEIFVVDEEIISSYSGRIRNLFGKSKNRNRYLKVIFHDFPGGAVGFELAAKFCYNGGRIPLNPLNVSLLHCVAHFMEMNKISDKADNLLQQTEKSLEEIRYWSWSELLAVLKQCQDLIPTAISSGLIDKCLDSLVERLSLLSEPSPCPSSSSSAESSGFRLSCDTKSTESSRNSLFRATWLFDDLVALTPQFVKLVIKSMVSHKIDHGIVSRFLFYYQKSRFSKADSNHKIEVFETVVEGLHCLDWSAVSCKSLFGILRVGQGLNIGKCCKAKLESMIGSRLDQATLDNLLVPSPVGMSCLYDVNLVLRFLESFLGKRECSVTSVQLKKVAVLMDLYIAEVAPDPCLKPSKFLALVRALPHSARDSYDAIYRAIDMYLEVHGGLSEEEKLRICCALNYEKLSSEACKHLAKNSKFPSKSVIQALVSQRSKLKSLLQETKLFPESPCDLNKDEECEQIVLYAGKLDLSAENEELREHLQGMQWRVLELEKVCKKMQIQMTKIMKSRLSSQNSARSLPRMCS